jgi:hypothetical protein
MTAITLSFTSSSFTFKRNTRNKRTGGYFVMLEGKLIKEYATYESALKCYRKHQGSCIIPRASATKFYAEQLQPF